MKIEPIVKTISVSLPAAEAFELFTSRINEWWPLGSHSVSAGQKATARSLVLEPRLNGELVETGHDGTLYSWGHIQVWEPGVRFTMSWHPGQPADRTTTLNVAFHQDGETTKVTLTHSGWEVLGEEGQSQRDGYNGGWDGVLSQYTAAT